MRQREALNRGWKTLARPEAGFAAPAFDDQHWQEVCLPHTNLELPLDNFDPSSFRFSTGYRHRITVDPRWRSHRVFVCFEAVMARAQVWIDGALVAEHRGGYTGFEVELPPQSLSGPSCLVAVLADADENPGIPPFGHAVDYLTFGGIYREVQLEIRPANYLNSATIETPAARGAHPRVTGMVFLERAWQGQAPLVATVRVCDPSTGQEGGQAAVGWAPGSVSAPYEIEVPGAKPWDLAHPHLYELRVETHEDTLVRRFGFRQAEFRSNGFFLNGKHVKLRGLNRHQSWPVVGYAMPRRAQAADADLLKKQLGCNIVRSSHYPPSRHFLDRCDEIGLLVFEEIPGWQHIGNDEWKAVALSNLEEMVARDRHHPSVILWGVRINESPDDDDFYRRTNALARALDPSRPTGGVRNFAGSRLFEDVYTFNDFVHAGGRKILQRRTAVAKARVPYLVTEFGGHMFPTKKADTESRRVEHALRHARVQNAAAADSQLAGALGWCLADYATHADFGSGDQICHHGVVDQFRTPKLAADFYASQGEVPFGRVASRMANGEHDGASLGQLWVFTNSEEVRLFVGSRHVGTFRPDRRRFGALPHPPIPIDDLIGNTIEEEPGLSGVDAARLKAFFQALRRLGRVPFWQSLPVLWVMLKKRWVISDLYALHGRHVTAWGAAARHWRFEGWTQGEKVWEQSLGPAWADRLEIEVDTVVLEEGDCWDVVRAQVRLLDQRGNDVWFGNAPVTLAVTGPLVLQGPATRPLTGGSTAFWLATNGREGTATLKAHTSDRSSPSVSIQIRRSVS